VNPASWTISLAVFRRVASGTSVMDQATSRIFRKSWGLERSKRGIPGNPRPLVEVESYVNLWLWWETLTDLSGPFNHPAVTITWWRVRPGPGHRCNARVRGAECELIEDGERGRALAAIWSKLPSRTSPAIGRDPPGRGISLSTAWPSTLDDGPGLGASASGSRAIAGAGAAGVIPAAARRQVRDADELGQPRRRLGRVAEDPARSDRRASHPERALRRALRHRRAHPRDGRTLDDRDGQPVPGGSRLTVAFATHGSASTRRATSRFAEQQRRAPCGPGGGLGPRTGSRARSADGDRVDGEERGRTKSQAMPIAEGHRDRGEQDPPAGGAPRLRVTATRRSRIRGSIGPRSGLRTPACGRPRGSLGRPAGLDEDRRR